MGWFEDLLNDIGLGELGINVGGVADLAGPALLSYGINQLFPGFTDPQRQMAGYQGGIPEYVVQRERVPGTYDPNRRPGSGGQRYFTDIQYVPAEGAAARTPLTAQELAALNVANPAQQPRASMAGGGSVQNKQTGDPSYVMYNDNYYKVAPDGVTVTLYGDPVPENIAREVLSRNYEDTQLNRRLSKDASRASDEVFGGLLRLLLGDRRPTEGDLGEMTPAYMTSPNYYAGGIATMAQGRYLNGSSDGMADQVPARIDGMQEARLSDGEFVIPADVVSHFGNGNSDAGAKELYAMMDRVRKARTGTTKQGKQINPSKMLPA